MYLIFGIFKWTPHQHTTTTTPKTQNIYETKNPEIQTIEKFNWGAAFLSGLWALFNGSYWIFFLSIFISACLISLVQVFGGLGFLIALIIGFWWCVICGLKGNEWALKNKKWRDLEHFNSVQKKWERGAAVVATVLLLLSILTIRTFLLHNVDQNYYPSMEASSSPADYTNPAETSLKLPSSPAIYPTSFDCNSARITLSAKYICENSTLADLDVRMANIYAEVISPLDFNGKRALISEQKKWLHERNQCTSQENPFNCMLEAYSNRIKELNFYKTNGFSEPESTPNSASATEIPQVEAPQKEEVLSESEENPSKPEEEQQEQVYLKPKESLAEPEKKSKTNQKENTPDYLKKYIE